MLSSLISSDQIADNADRVTLMATRGILVRGIYNQVMLEGVYSIEQAAEKLREGGYVVTRQWLTGQYGSQEAFIGRV
jgi:hypothetical protein